MQQLHKIGIDLMGNDNVPQDILQTLEKLNLPKGIELVFIGTQDLLPLVKTHPFVAAAEFIGMEENPLLALRKKKQASIPVGLRLLKEGKIDAFVSAGSTGALVSSAKLILKTMKKISRPSLLTLMPTKKKPIAVLDVGANIRAKTAHLVQFAKLGIAYQKARGIQHPKVGLLNIGSEALKGTDELKDAYNELQKSSASCFVGNIEGKTVFDGHVDVIVTDGFTGNIFLKTAEGVASLILDKINVSYLKVKKFQSLHYAEYPGALLIGVLGIVIKCHGYSSLKGFENAVLGASRLAKEEIVQKLLNELR